MQRSGEGEVEGRRNGGGGYCSSGARNEGFLEVGEEGRLSEGGGDDGFDVRLVDYRDRFVYSRLEIRINCTQWFQDLLNIDVG